MFDAPVLMHAPRKLQYREMNDPETWELADSFALRIQYLAERHAIGEFKNDVEDLFQVGFVAALEAAKTFDATCGLKFATYAQHRVHGAIIDYQRDQIWGKRAAHEARRNPKPGEHCPTVCSLSTLVREEKSTRRMQDRMDSIHSLTDSRQEPKYTEDFLQSRMFKAFRQRERKILFLYYWEEKTMDEIGKEVGLSESRVSQIHTEMLEHIRSKGKPDWMYADAYAEVT